MPWTWIAHDAAPSGLVNPVTTVRGAAPDLEATRVPSASAEAAALVISPPPRPTRRLGITYGFATEYPAR
ncbi:hypothetical protein [Methylorubrum populi]|uniref:hypothetical protein n=1 Tax=Methylorubrum populi TaxID=223967 RepID=UPI0012FF70F4|nr:hypothetical protein [Methylorubrum populi]